MFQVNERVTDLKGYKGTVRYVGLLPLENDSRVWYGIEWDDDNRGKHNGSVKDKNNQIVQIFQCPEGHGSFVRENKIQKGISIEEAIIERYTNPEEGEDQLAFRYKPISELESVALESNRVSFVRGDLHVLCPRLKSINLSSNLIYQTSFILSLLKECPQLESLYMSRNPLLVNDLPSDSSSAQPFSLSILSLGFCHIHQETLASLSPLLSSLQALYLHGNPLKNICESTIHSFMTHLKLFDLSNCEISDWSILDWCSRFHSIESLNLSQNQLKDTQMMGGPLECSIHTLDINHNDIHSMTTLQHLFQALPSLSSLLCLYTPLYNQYEDTLLIREEIIASFSSLKSLNNTNITDKEREESELYYLKQWLLKCMERAGCSNIKEWQRIPEEQQQQYLSLYPRYSELVRIHGEPVISDNTRTAQNNLLTHSIVISFKHLNTQKVIKRKFPLQTTVKQLKQVLCKLFKLDPLKAVFYHSRDGILDVINCETDTLGDYNLQNGDELIIEENEDISYKI